jgi:hypothetical protein
MGALVGGEIQMGLSENVYVMNTDTWNIWRKRIMEEAEKLDNPMDYMKVIGQLEIILDDRLRTNVIEVYEKSVFGEIEDDYESEK